MYAPGIGRFAAGHGCFGGAFSFDRMSWIKPNFLWMMHRCGWGTKAGQEVVLAVWLRRVGFDQILRQAVPSSFDAALFTGHEAWQRAVRGSSVRLQWGPRPPPLGREA